MNKLKYKVFFITILFSFMVNSFADASKEKVWVYVVFKSKEGKSVGHDVFAGRRNEWHNYKKSKEFLDKKKAVDAKSYAVDSIRASLNKYCGSFWRKEDDKGNWQYYVTKKEDQHKLQIDHQKKTKLYRKDNYQLIDLSCLYNIAD